MCFDRGEMLSFLRFHFRLKLISEYGSICVEYADFRVT